MNYVLVGCGNMGSAIVRGAVNSGMMKGHELICIDTDIEKANSLAKELNSGSGTSIQETSTEDTCFIIAVKPHAVDKVIKSLAKKESDVIVSVAAGVSFDTLKEASYPAKAIRTMPNTPAMVGEGVTALYSDLEIPGVIRELFESVGKVVILELESLFDAVTGLSGSGPAYIFVAIEALADGGVRMGLPRKIALELAMQTIVGAAKLAQASNLHPGELKDNVASPGGATIAALEALEQGGYRSALINAVKASAERSQEMAKERNNAKH